MKTKLILSVFCVLSAYWVLSIAYCFAAVPPLINYQGVLTKSPGVPQNGEFSMVFSIYSDSTGGDLLWNETQDSVQVTRGLFSVLLGSVNPIPDSIFKEPNRWLEVEVEGSLLLPRRQIVTVGYAFHSGFTDTAEYALSAPRDDDWTPDTAGFNIYRLTGGVGIGTPSPQYRLDVAGTAQMTGFKMPTGASDGYVLTSDDNGLGTWQATSGPSGCDTCNYAWNADKVDGQHASAFLTIANDYGRSGVASDLYEETQTLTERYVNEGQASSINSPMILDNTVASIDITDGTIVDADISNTASIAPSKISGTAWTTTNDGSGSGLDADMVDGIHASTTPESNKLLALDSQGKFPSSVLPPSPIIKSVQSGEQTLSFGAPAAGTINVTISAVNTSKAFCIVGGANTGVDGNVSCGGRLTSSTNLQIRYSVDNNQGNYFVWQVIEFY
jgi:hypothetical protein